MKIILYLIPLVLLTNTIEAQISPEQFTNRMVERLNTIDPQIRRISTPGIIQKEYPNNVYVSLSGFLNSREFKRLWNLAYRQEGFWVSAEFNNWVSIPNGIMNEYKIARRTIRVRLIHGDLHIDYVKW